MRRIVTVAALATALIFPATSRAGTIDWSAHFAVSDGDSTYMNLSMSHFGGDRDDAVAVARTLGHPGRDLPVLLFLARESGRSLSFVARLRNGGLSWWEIRARLGVPPERVIVALPRDPGPPYGKAHGHYRNGKRGRTGATLILSDAEFRDWVGVRVLARSYDLDPMVVVEARQAGVSLAEFSLQRRSDRGPAAAAGPPPGKKGGAKPKAKARKRR